MTDSVIRIGTRGSKLALWQAEFTKTKLENLGHKVELKIIKTQGDIIQHLSFDKMEGKGFFTKEIEDHLLRGDIDLAVHSMKDLTTSSPKGLVTTAVSYRENPSDALLIRTDRLDETLDFGLPSGAKVGTSSMRRKSQIKYFRPDIQTVDIRGNVQTRINKLYDHNLDAIMLANAGLIRISPDLSGITLKILHPREFVPAPAQGVLVYQVHENNKPLRKILQSLHHREVANCTNIERGVLKALEGGCLIPLGVYCEIDVEGYYHVWSAYAENMESPLKRYHCSYATKSGIVEDIVQHLKEN